MATIKEIRYSKVWECVEDLDEAIWKEAQSELKRQLNFKETKIKDFRQYLINYGIEDVLLEFNEVFGEDF